MQIISFEVCPRYGGPAPDRHTANTSQTAEGDFKLSGKYDNIYYLLVANENMLWK